MIRPFTLITMLLAALSGAYLFAVKHHAQMLDDQIASISQASRLDAQRIRVLEAQWALETDPTRLQQLATQFTGLQPMQPAQLVTLAALKTDLPAPGTPPPLSNPELPGQVPPELQDALAQSAAQAAAARSAVEVAGALPLPPPQAPVAASVAAPVAAPAVMASAVAAAKPFVRLVHRLSHSSLAGSQLAEASIPRSYAAPRVFAPAPYAPADRGMPMGAQAMSLKASSAAPQSVPGTPPVSGDDSGSALGMAANLPPPQPLQQDGINN